MALLCIPVSRLVSCTFSTIPICPFLEFFHLLVSALFLLANYLYMLLLDYISNFISSFTYQGLELMRLLTVELCSIKMCVAGSRSVLCNINARDPSHYMRHCMME